MDLCFFKSLLPDMKLMSPNIKVKKISVKIFIKINDF